MIKPLANKIVLKPFKTKTSNVIVYKEPKNSYLGTVVAIGENVNQINKGDTIVFKKEECIEVYFLNELYLIVDKDHLLAVIEDE